MPIVTFALVLFVGPAPLPRPLPITSPLIDKNFYFLSLLERSPDFQKAWQKDKQGLQLQERLRERLREAFQDASLD